MIFSFLSPPFPLFCLVVAAVAIVALWRRLYTLRERCVYNK